MKFIDGGSSVFVIHLLIVFNLSNFSVVLSFDTKMDFDPDTFLPTNKIISRRGFPSESHEVVTEDGYILTVHRIPRRKTDKKTAYKKDHVPTPVFMQHGVLGSSADWILHGESNSLAFRLADKGHDIWLGNIRGNTYSNAHVSMSPNCNDFWDYSLTEIAIHDLTAMIDYVLDQTGHKKLIYIGHSMGTTIFWILCSLKPEYNAKIKIMFALAPVAFMSSALSPIRYFAPFAGTIQVMTNWFGKGEFPPHREFISGILRKFCRYKAIRENICKNFLFALVGYSPEEFYVDLIPAVFGHTPAGSSAKMFYHFAQLIKSGLFQSFDYGPIENKKIYNSEIPPLYDLKLVTAPVTLVFSENDYLAHLHDVKKLALSLDNLIEVNRINFKSFSHFDFLWGKNINTLVNRSVLFQIWKVELGVFVLRASKQLDESIFSVNSASVVCEIDNEITSVLNLEAGSVITVSEKDIDKSESTKKQSWVKSTISKQFLRKLTPPMEDGDDDEEAVT